MKPFVNFYFYRSRDVEKFYATIIALIKDEISYAGQRSRGAYYLNDFLTLKVVSQLAFLIASVKERIESFKTF